jgi:hypothetical protein
MSSDKTFRDKVDEIVEKMACNIGESKDERRDDTSMIFGDMKQAILALIESDLIGESESLSEEQVKGGRIYILGDPQADAVDRFKDKQRTLLQRGTQE